MTSQAYKTMVGAFVLGGIGLFALGLVLLAGSRLFSNDLEYVLYFDGSVSGLSIGAPVVFRAVPMGSVTQISLVANSRDSNVTIPVHIRIDEKSIVRAGGRGISEAFQQEIVRRMVQRGLRARLQLQSLITGQYRIELDFHPDTPANFRSSTPDLEIPTIPSPIDTLQRTLAKLPLEQMVHSLDSILEDLAQALADGKLKEGIAAFAVAAILMPEENSALYTDFPEIRLCYFLPFPELEGGNFLSWERSTGFRIRCQLLGLIRKIFECITRSEFNKELPLTRVVGLVWILRFEERRKAFLAMTRRIAGVITCFLSICF